MSDIARRTLLGIAFVAAVIAALAVARQARAPVGTTAEGTQPPPAGSVTSGAPTATASPAEVEIAPTDPQPLPDVLIDPAVIVKKALRRLTIVSDGEPVKHYRIALGSEPTGHKQLEGDGRTPEGTYYVCSKNAASKYHRSLGLAYPNEEDAESGLARGAISSKEQRAIVGAIRRMAAPPWKTGLGGEIMIHGGGSGRGDWTQGCIALDDPDAEELFTALPLGTAVIIRP